MADWGAIDKAEAENKKDFKDYAPEGFYTTTISGVELIHSSQKGTPGFNFTADETGEYKMPKFGTTHWLSFNNEGWRLRHFRALMMVLGADKSAAEKAIDTCESKKTQDEVEKMYLAMLEKLVSKKPTVDVVVFKRYTDSKYPNWDFNDRSVRMGRTEEREVVSEPADPLAGAGEVDLSDSDLPF